MSSANNNATIGVDHLKQSWGTLAKAGAIFATLAASFISPPPENLLSGTEGGIDPPRFAGFILVVVLGFLVLLMVGWSKKEHFRHWGLMAGVSLVMTIGGAFTYVYSLQTQTTLYDAKRVIIGSEYTPSAIAYLKANPSTGNAALLLSAGGHVDYVWRVESIAANSITILAIYLWLFVGAGATALCISHAVYCAQKMH